MAEDDRLRFVTAVSAASGELQQALESRVVIEQAKGMTATQHEISIDQAYHRIRLHARSNNASLRTVAQAIVAVGLQV